MGEFLECFVYQVSELVDGELSRGFQALAQGLTRVFASPFLDDVVAHEIILNDAQVFARSQAQLSEHLLEHVLRKVGFAHPWHSNREHYHDLTVLLNLRRRLLHCCRLP